MIELRFGPHFGLLPLISAALFWAGFSCAKGTGSAENVCETDLDCLAPGTGCDLEAKQCVCRVDEACAEGSFCNKAGVCQALAGCGSNLDCASQRGTYCDLQSGNCLQGPELQLGSLCGLASHCPYGTLCVSGKCETGCADDGDCALGSVCSDGVCGTGENICSNDLFCDYGERCVGLECKKERGPFCRGCTQRTLTNPEPCDESRNFCLLNNLESGGFSQICGVDCSLGQPCPNGYDCHGVTILTRDPCQTTAECRCNPSNIRPASAICGSATPCTPRLPTGELDPDGTTCSDPGHPDCNGGVRGGDSICIIAKTSTTGICTCTGNEDCAGGGVCVAGLCCTGTVRDDRECAVGENRVAGFCTCATDDDCPRDACDGSRRACAITGNPCAPGGNDCGAIPCIDGACFIGNNCAPIQGLSCSVVGN